MNQTIEYLRLSRVLDIALNKNLSDKPLWIQICQKNTIKSLSERMEYLRCEIVPYRPVHFFKGLYV